MLLNQHFPSVLNNFRFQLQSIQPSNLLTAIPSHLFHTFASQSTRGMPDFTPHTYKLLLSSLLDQNYSFQSFLKFLKNPESRSVILRHDVDARKMNSLKFALLENELGIRGTYYFRMVPESFDTELIKQIYDLGHEIGYHYEDLSVTAQRRRGTEAQWQKGSAYEELLAKMAIKNFKENLEKFRKIVPVETICMHGSPLSIWDNRLLWKYYDYRDFGIVGEPYFDIDFEKVLYLTDTGRRWDGGDVAIRDKVTGKEEMMRRGGDEGKGREEMMRRGGDEEMRRGRNNGRGGDEEKGSEEVMRGEGDEEMRRVGDKERVGEEEKGREGDKKYRDKAIPPSPFPPLSHSLSNRFHSTFDIINAAREKRLPNQIMLTVHPQRWDDQPFHWIWELAWQNVKNIVKGAIVKRSGKLSDER